MHTMLWQYTAHEPEVDAVIAVTFMRSACMLAGTCSRRSLSTLPDLAVSSQVSSLATATGSIPKTVECQWLHLLVGHEHVQVWVALVDVSSLAGPMMVRRVGSSMRGQETRMLKHTRT